MSVVESITMIAPEPSIDPAAPTSLPSNGRSSWSGKNHGADPPPGTNVFRSLPLRMPPLKSLPYRRSRNVVVPLTISNTPGRSTCPDTATMRVPGDVSVPIVVYSATPLHSSHGRLASVSTLLTIVGWP